MFFKRKIIWAFDQSKESLIRESIMKLKMQTMKLPDKVILMTKDNVLRCSKVHKNV